MSSAGCCDTNVRVCARRTVSSRRTSALRPPISPLITVAMMFNHVGLDGNLTRYRSGVFLIGSRTPFVEEGACLPCHQKAKKLVIGQKSHVHVGCS